jgi:hypothetical protein
MRRSDMWVALGDNKEFGRWPTKTEAEAFCWIQRRKIKGAGLAKDPVADMGSVTIASKMTWTTRRVEDE